MEELTFGEQVKIVLGRKGMTIKALAREIEEKTGRKMSRQNLTQRLGRDNFQEQDMRMIAEILGCPFHLSILSGEEPLSQAALQKNQAKRQAQPAPKEETKHVVERDMTVGEFVNLFEKAAAEAAKEETAGSADSQPLPAAKTGETVQEHAEENTISAGPAKHADSRKAEPESRASEAEAPHIEVILKESKPEKSSASAGRDVQQKELRKRNTTPAPASLAQETNEEPAGEINPYTGREYETDSVRSHPSRIGYVQVYDRSIHGWTDMTEWAFLGYQERKKALLGRDYKPPVYLD